MESEERKVQTFEVRSKSTDLGVKSLISIFNRNSIPSAFLRIYIRQPCQRVRISPLESTNEIHRARFLGVIHGLNQQTLHAQREMDVLLNAFSLSSEYFTNMWDFLSPISLVSFFSLSAYASSYHDNAGVLRFVNPKIGTFGITPNGNGGMIPSVSPPFGMTRWTAQTRSVSFYQYV